MRRNVSYIYEIIKVQSSKAYRKSGAAKAAPAAPLPTAMSKKRFAPYEVLMHTSIFFIFFFTISLLMSVLENSQLSELNYMVTLNSAQCHNGKIITALI